MKGPNESQELRDDREWEDRVERRAGHPVSVVFSVRFHSGEIREVQEAAQRVGEKTSEFIRRAAMARARGSSALEIESLSSTSPTAGRVDMFGAPADKTASSLWAEYTAA